MRLWAGCRPDRKRARVISKVMREKPTPAYLMMRYIDVDPGRVFHELSTMSTDLAKGLLLMRQHAC